MPVLGEQLVSSPELPGFRPRPEQDRNRTAAVAVELLPGEGKCVKGFALGGAQVADAQGELGRAPRGPGPQWKRAARARLVAHRHDRPPRRLVPVAHDERPHAEMKSRAAPRLTDEQLLAQRVANELGALRGRRRPELRRQPRPVGEYDAPEQRVGRGGELDRLRAAPALGITARVRDQRVECGGLDGHLHVRVRLRRELAFDQLCEFGVAAARHAQPREPGQDVDPAPWEKRLAQALPQAVPRTGEAGVECRRRQLREDEAVLVVGGALALGALQVPDGSRRGATPGGIGRRGPQRQGYPGVFGGLASQQMRRRRLSARTLLDQRLACGSVKALPLGRHQAVADRRGDPTVGEPIAGRHRQPSGAQRLPGGTEFAELNAGDPRSQPWRRLVRLQDRQGGCDRSFVRLELSESLPDRLTSAAADRPLPFPRIPRRRDPAACELAREFGEQPRVARRLR